MSFAACASTLCYTCQLLNFLSKHTAGTYLCPLFDKTVNSDKLSMSRGGCKQTLLACEHCPWHLQQTGRYSFQLSTLGWLESSMSLCSCSSHLQSAVSCVEWYVIWMLYVDTCGSSSLCMPIRDVHVVIHGHVGTLISKCWLYYVLVEVIYMYIDGSLPNNHQSLSGSNFINSVIFRQQHAQYTYTLQWRWLQDWEHQMYTFGTVLTTSTSGALHWHQTGWS